MQFVSALCFLLSLLSPVSALYEDQVGQTDWYNPFVGIPNEVHFSYSEKLNSILLSKNSISKLNLKNDEIEWRHILPQHETIIKSQLQKSKLYTLSNPGGLRIWTLNGELLNENGLSDSFLTKNEHSLPETDFVLNDDNLVLLHNDTLTAFDSSNNKKWKLELPQEVRYFSLFSNENAIYVTGLNGSILTTQKIEQTDSARIVSNHKCQYDIAPHPSTTVVSNSKIYGLHGYERKLVVFDVVSGDSKVVDLKNYKEPILAIRTLGEFLELRSSKQKHVAIIKDNELVFESDHSLESALGFQDDSVVSIKSSGDEIVINHPKKQPIRIPLNVSSEIVKVWFQDLILLLTTKDGSFLAIDTTTNKILSKREEGLSEIKGIEFAELPSSASEFGTVLERWSRQVESLGAFAKNSVKMLINLPALLLGKTQESEIQLQQDTFGFRKLILAYNDHSLYAMESLKGHLVWKRSFNNIEQLKMLSHSTAALISHSDKGSILHLIDALTGKSQQKMSIENPIVDSVVLPLIYPKSGLRILALLDSENQFHIYPKESDKVIKFSNFHKEWFYYEVLKSKRLIRGYRVQYRESNYILEQTWQFNTENFEKIEVFASSMDQTIHSSLRALGADVKHKYLNPNLLVVVTSRLRSNERVSSVRISSDPCLSVYLIDAVSGHLIDKLIHPNAHAPVSLVVSENSVIYSFYSSTHHMTQLSVIDLWQKRSESHSLGHLISESLFNKKEEFSSFSPVGVAVTQQSYLYRQPIHALAVTNTRKGLTSKMILAVIGSNSAAQLMGFHKSLLDSLRSQEAQPVMIENAPLPYSGELLHEPKQILSYYRLLSHVRVIKASPTLLESTSLVAVAGKELMLVRTMPSGTFDMLNPDFNYLFLIATVSGVLCAIAVTKVLSEKKQLKQAWR